MELATMLILIAAVIFAAYTRDDGRHRAGEAVADLLPRLSAERRTYLPLRGW